MRHIGLLGLDFADADAATAAAWLAARPADAPFDYVVTPPMPIIWYGWPGNPL